MIENLKFCIKEKGLSIHAYVVMTNHLHMIVRSEKDKDLAGLIRDFKRFTAKKIYEELKKIMVKVGVIGCYGSWKAREKRVLPIKIIKYGVMRIIL